MATDVHRYIEIAFLPIREHPQQSSQLAPHYQDAYFENDVVNMIVDFSKSGFVYFIQQGEKNIFKIGITQHSPLKRLSQLQTGSSEKLSLIGFLHVLDMKYAEKYVHRLFWERRLEGEWFEGDIKQIIKWLDESENNCTFIHKSNLVHHLTLLEMKLWHFKEEMRGKLHLETNFFSIGYYSKLFIIESIQIEKIGKNLKMIDFGTIANARGSTSIDADALSLVKRLLHDFSQSDVYYKTVENSHIGYFFFVRNPQDQKDILAFDKLSIDEKETLLESNILWLQD